MIIMIMFVDREAELETLGEVARSKKAELVLMYGRRRVGKSRLLAEFAKHTGALYLLADVSENILEILGQQAGGFVRFGNWEDFFSFLLTSDHKIIIIDEFQYLYQINKAWPTILQRWWEKLKETDKKIILCGSMVSTIYKISMGYGSALYGRKTREIELTPLPFRFVRRFFPRYTMAQAIEAYAVLGGVPRYLEEFDGTSTIDANILAKILDKTSFLYNEPMNLLFEEFRSPAPYVSILLAITQGQVKFGEIADASTIESHRLPKYLTVLERAGIIERDVPVTERKVRVKTTRYRIRDNFYRFWFTFLFRNKARIEQGLQKAVMDDIRKVFAAYVGKAFEDVCREFMVDTQLFPLTAIGRWWHKDREIDIVAVNETEMLLGECKWQERVDGRKLLAALKEKGEALPGRKTYVLFARSFARKFTEPGVLLFDLEDMKKEWSGLRA